ncbi:MAG: hypothetical protein AB8B69_19350 [Chitinophagales bacterium]
MIKEKSEEMYQQAVDIITRRGFKDIKANSEELGLEVPTGYVQQEEGKEDTYIPDLTALFLGRKSYFEISLKTTNTRRLVNKWKLMSKLAEIRDGNFFLLAPKGHLRFTNQLVEAHSIKAEVIKLY